MSQQGVNKLIVLGHVGNDADLKFTSGGKPVANFSVAANESFKNSNGDSVDRVEWFRCVAWNGLAELCGQYLTRGKQVYLEGRLQTRKYDDKDGNARTTTEVVVSTLRLLGGPRNGSSQAEADRGGTTVSDRKWLNGQYGGRALLGVFFPLHSPSSPQRVFAASLGATAKLVWNR